jgi:hypothetical protein
LLEVIWEVRPEEAIEGEVMLPTMPQPLVGAVGSSPLALDVAAVVGSNPLPLGGEEVEEEQEEEEFDLEEEE